ncbi:MAG: phage tail protein, partial [Candidatus Diapherotrites archaeon]|nr:phage tail protein [Candidatus Diapherotrites archaeon]
QGSGNLRIFLDNDFQEGVQVLHELKAQVPVARAADGTTSPSGSVEVTAKIEYNSVADNEFSEWWASTGEGNSEPKNVLVAIYNSAGEREISWTLLNAVPTDVNALSGNLNEIISLRAEGIERDYAGTNSAEVEEVESEESTEIIPVEDNSDVADELIVASEEDETIESVDEANTSPPQNPIPSINGINSIITLENKAYNWYTWPEPIQLRAEAVSDSNIDLVEQYAKRLSDNYYWDESIQEGARYVGGWVPAEKIKRFDYTRQTTTRRAFWNLTMDDNKFTPGNYVISVRSKNKAGVFSDWNSVNFSFQETPHRLVYFTNPVADQVLTTGGTFNIRGVCLDRQDLAGGYGCTQYQNCGAPNYAGISYKDANAPDNFNSWRTLRSQSQYDPIESRFYINGSCDYNWRLTQGTSCSNNVCTPTFDTNKTYNLRLQMTPRCSQYESCQQGQTETINIRFRNP